MVSCTVCKKVVDRATYGTTVDNHGRLIHLGCNAVKSPCQHGVNPGFACNECSIFAGETVVVGGKYDDRNSKYSDIEAAKTAVDKMRMVIGTQTLVDILDLLDELDWRRRGGPQQEELITLCHKYIHAIDIIRRITDTHNPANPNAALTAMYEGRRLVEETDV